MYYIGIDLAWKSTKSSGVLVMDDHRKIVFKAVKAYTNQELVELIARYSPNICSVDGPLVVRNEKGARACDRLLMKTALKGTYLKLYATSKTYMLKTFGEIRGQDISRICHHNKLESKLIETYPTGIFLILGDDYKKKYKLSSRLGLEELKAHASDLLNQLKSLGFEGFKLPLEEINKKVTYKPWEDLIDAYLCSINSYFYGQGGCQSFSCDDNGAIYLPRVRTLE